MARYTRSQAKSWARSLSGYLVVLATPFDDAGELDEEGLKRNVDYTLSLPGATGLYLSSNYQEFWTMTLAERKRVTEIVVETAAGRGTVMVGITDPSSRNAVDLARHAERAGADMLMLWPPFYGPRSDDGMMAYFEYVAERVDLGICTYSTTISELGFYITPDLACRLADIDTVCALKEGSRSLSGYTGMMEAAGDKLVVSSPLEEYALFGLATYGRPRVPAVLLGSSRPLYVQSQSQPNCAVFAEALGKGDVAKASEALAKILDAANRIHNRFVSKGTHHVALFKYITSLHGMAAGPVRAPLTPPGAWEMEEARKVLTEVGVLPDVTGERPGIRGLTIRESAK
jgi:4-hydroxy-tetrahydrodipicolinate synthase